MKMRYLSLRSSRSRRSKERTMKRSLSHWLSLPALAGLLVFGLASTFAQTTPAAGEMGKIHGQVINPTGQPQGGGNVNLSTDGGATFKFTFDVSPDGNFSGQAAPGNYALIYRAADTPKGQMVDEVKDVKIVAGQDIEVNDDMSRAEYLAKMTPEQRKQLEELKKTNAEALKANAVIGRLNADLKAVAQDQQDVDNAPKTAAQQLGASASRADIATKTEEIKTVKYNDIESIMSKDTAAKPDEAILWAKLAYAQAGLKQYDDAIDQLQEGDRSGNRVQEAAYGRDRRGTGRPRRSLCPRPARWRTRIPRSMQPPRTTPPARLSICATRPSSSSSRGMPMPRSLRRKMPSR